MHGDLAFPDRLLVSPQSHKQSAIADMRAKAAGVKLQRTLELPLGACPVPVIVEFDITHCDARPGKLLIDFISSEEGQRVLAASNYLPAMPSVAAKTPSLKPEAGGFKPIYVPPESFARDGERWQKIYNELFR